MLSKHVGAVKGVLKKWFKNKWYKISSFVGCVIISELQFVFAFDSQNYKCMKEVSTDRKGW